MSTVQELQQKALETRSELQAVKAQIASLERSIQLVDLTQQQVHTEVGNEATVWQGVGKMFMATTTSDYDQVLKVRGEDVKEQISALEKKELYFETTLNNLTRALSEISA